MHLSVQASDRVPAAKCLGGIREAESNAMFCDKNLTLPYPMGICFCFLLLFSTSSTFFDFLLLCSAHFYFIPPPLQLLPLLLLVHMPDGPSDLQIHEQLLSRRLTDILCNASACATSHKLALLGFNSMQSMLGTRHWPHIPHSLPV